MTAILKIEGIGEKYATKLKQVKINTVEELLAHGATVKGRDELVEKTGISKDLILRWVNHADLFRIKGVGEEYSDLLEDAGVDTVPELAQRSAEHLYEKLVEVNKVKKSVRQLPSQKAVAKWIQQAKKLTRVIDY